MRLPNAKVALVEPRKITDYLLNREHPDNGGKADFFIKLGFASKNWGILADALRSLAANSLLTQSMESPHGKKYIVDGRIESPLGRAPIVRTIWIVDRGETIPRLITAYPHED